MKAITPILVILLSAASFRDVLAAENVEVKTLSAKEFSKYAANLCKKLKLSGPAEITSLAQRQSLLTVLNRLQLEKELQLDSVEIKENAKAKAKIQSEINVIVKELHNFPKLHYKRVDGYVDPSPTHSTLAPTITGYSNSAPLGIIGSGSAPAPALTDSKYPLLSSAGAKYHRPAPFRGKYRTNILSGPDYQIKFNVLQKSTETLIHDSISVVREQIKLKHGENYVK
ncbi:hypothetical protein KA183_07830 [bacterium]|nr:hypothetical protein [bacterium]